MRRALVTGGGGFLGRAVLERLLARGVAVVSFSRGAYPELACLGAEVVQGDLADGAALAAAAAGCDTVFHVAAKAGIWGPHEEYRVANVVGTENVLAACRANGVRRLVYTSSPSVVFDGRDMAGADERAPYPSHYENSYAATKAEAERAVLAANGPELATVALRPHLIWGPRDPNLVPRLVARAKAGVLRQVGDGKNLVDTVYVDNAADAHLLAADRLEPGSALAGRAYFISQGEPRPLWDVVNRILDAAGLPPVTRRVPAWAAYAAGCAFEAVWGLLGIRSEPRMTRFVARELATAHWFDLGAARRDLGYEPRVSFEEGIERLRAWFKEERRGERKSDWAGK